MPTATPCLPRALVSVRKSATMEAIPFLSLAEAEHIRHNVGTPAYVYDEARMRRAANEALAFPNAFGLTVRYAMKANPNAAILRLFESMGLHFDASSGHEVERLLRMGAGTTHISLSSQELPKNFADMVEDGVAINACSLHQLEAVGRRFPGARVGVRFNPGLGSGSTNRTNVGGPASSFGIWHERLPEVLEVAGRYGLEIYRIHTHIGSGSDPAVWQRAAGLTLNLARAIASVTTVNLGGGFKVARVAGERGTHLTEIGEPVKILFEQFAEETGRKLHLEIEPGTYLVANAGAILSTIQDIVSTGPEGYTFYKLDTGMTEILRPSMYGAQHGFEIISSGEPGSTHPVVIVGHCCEAGDILTPAAGDSEALAPRQLASAAIGDYCVITGAGAYCAAMPAKNYNSFPEAPELLRTAENGFRLIRKRQTLSQMLANETNESLGLASVGDDLRSS